MRESKDLNKIELHDIFADLKAYEFELGVRTEEDTSTSQVTKALTAADETPVTKTAEQISSDAMSLFVKKFGRFMRKNHNNFQRANRSSFKSKEPAEENRACYNCGKEGHFIADCTKPKKDEKRTLYKKNSREERKRFSRKKEQKALLEDESNSKWAESDSTSSDSETSSSESEEEAAKCLMANNSDIPDDGEFDEVRTNGKGTTDKSDQSNSNEYTGSDSLKAQINLLMAENNDMRSKLQETLSENQRLTDLVNSWNKASISLDKLTEMQKQAGDKSGLGYNTNEGNKGELIKKTVWYLDSGCSRHMTGDRRMLSEYTPRPGPKITFGDNSKGTTMGKGKLIHGNIHIKDEKEMETLIKLIGQINQSLQSA
ncbi:uncharacterized protein [Henckelia pumila]|uniref:uncharacterized protein n=1 Tax=Henckelia pumila TaxID=405737 RepID=UPI003C6E435F